MVARLKWELGDSAGRDDVVQALLVVAQRLPDGPELAYVYSYVAEVSMLAGQSADAVEWADRALELMTPDNTMRSAALVNKGSALFDMPGHFDEGAALLEEAIELSIASHDVFSALRGLNNLLQGVLVRWEPERVWRHIARMTDLVQRFGRHDWVSGLAEITAAYYSDVMGDARAACDVLDAAISDSTADPGRKRSWLMSERAWLAAELNDEGAPDLLAEVRALNAAAHDPALQQPHWLESLEIEIALRAGDIETVSQGLGDHRRARGSRGGLVHAVRVDLGFRPGSGRAGGRFAGTRDRGSRDRARKPVPSNARRGLRLDAARSRSDCGRVGRPRGRRRALPGGA